MRMYSKGLLLVAAACGFYALALSAGAQNPAVPPAPPAPPSIVASVPPLPPSVPVAPAPPMSPPELAFPSLPAVPAMPAMPTLPAIPAMFDWSNGDHRHSVSISDGHHRPVTDCSGLHIRFDDHDAVVKSEEQTVTKGDAPTLRVHPHTNGGVQVEGWDKEVYSVVACKAAASYDGDAERILSQIKLSVQNGEVSTTGPNGEQEWTVYLLIRAPRASVIDMETANGPLSIYGVDGKLTARATNGPITLHDFSGEADVRASNGPITISGSSGSVHIHTENGPISINLKGKTWNGSGLTADAQNGPLTLSVPSDYQSSFSVESRNYSPMSCRASICDNARKTWDDNNRRIEFGASPAIIRLSTVNGPVSVRASREDM